MGRKRPYKVHIHFDGTKHFPDDAEPGTYVIDTSRPIDGTSAYPCATTATAAARRVSRNGGSARIVLRDPVTGDEALIDEFVPYQVAVEDLVHDDAANRS